MDQLKFDIVTADKNRQMKLTKKQGVVLLEALWDFKESIQSIDVNPECNLRKRILDHKQEEVNKLFDYLQDCINYNFEKHLQKCFKKSKNDDPGQETFSWLLDKKD
ncbi:hypothetical protein [Clostridium novyi]|uniref:hypothetical protein n=1 Tax=Clostridium novyi TaxID=1542 RepID=UPI0004D92903|nr:hypothetical protein [Clostridium novyi]KEH84562.1 hypothetical protein Z966_p0017 [Clostridium novyi A str. NCTC 538]KEH84636.1 hypothetical protein Z967_p0017 [Clostridium novyi A str. 4540]